MIGEIVVRQRMDERAQSGTADLLDHLVQGRLQEMHLILRDRMRARLAGSHCAHEDYVRVGREPNAEILRSVTLPVREVDVGVVGRVVVGLMSTLKL